MNEHDDALIDHVAAVWFEGGGDTLGFQYCRTKIHNAIARLENARDARNDSEQTID